MSLSLVEGTLEQSAFTEGQFVSQNLFNDCIDLVLLPMKFQKTTTLIDIEINQVNAIQCLI